MKVLHIRIGEWRHFNGLEISVPADAPLVCLVGGNGTGKSQILELLADAAHRIGLSHGYSGRRAEAFGEPADLEVKFQISKDSIPHLDASVGTFNDFEAAYASWDRTLLVTRTKNTGPAVHAGGVGQKSAALAREIIQRIKQSASVHYLMLDADRSYPPTNVGTSELGAAFAKDWEAEKKKRSFQQTKTLYDEWFQYLVGTENRDNAKLVADIRRARATGEAEPTFVDRMTHFKDAIRKVLPHLLFTGISRKNRPEFDASGVPLPFDALSGGEREIAFLVGQIERFGLKTGLLLVDEPELHLNYDLLRSWIGFLKDSVTEGQIWLATHSLEVVEVTGSHSSFLLERDDETRQVKSASSLSDSPVVATLSRSIGSPAFSISNLTFVFIEGDEVIGERERFRQLCGIPPNVRFIEGGNCAEVERRLVSLRAIADASGEPIKLGGIVDQDWRPASERRRQEGLGLHMLAVHEIENLFLHPPTVERVMRSIGQECTCYMARLTEACDSRAGIWIFNGARAQHALKKFPPPSEKTRALVQRLRWSDCLDYDATAQRIVLGETTLTDDQRAILASHITVYARIFERHRRDGELWKKCEGKEVFRSLAGVMGFSDPQIAERAIIKAWNDDAGLMPAELSLLRKYVIEIH